MAQETASLENLTQLQRTYHEHCVMCGAGNQRSLQLNFTLDADGAVLASHCCSAFLQGYPEMLHGGVISSLLDSAMTNCLFAFGHVAVTAKMEVLFRHPVRVGSDFTVRAWRTDTPVPGSLFNVRAEIRQDDRPVAQAKALFVRKQQ